MDGFSTNYPIVESVLEKLTFEIRFTDKISAADFHAYTLNLLNLLVSLSGIVVLSCDLLLYQTISKVEKPSRIFIDSNGLVNDALPAFFGNICKSISYFVLPDQISPKQRKSLFLAAIDFLELYHFNVEVTNRSYLYIITHFFEALITPITFTIYKITAYALEKLTSLGLQSDLSDEITSLLSVFEHEAILSSQIISSKLLIFSGNSRSALIKLMRNEAYATDEPSNSPINSIFMLNSIKNIVTNFPVYNLMLEVLDVSCSLDNDLVTFVFTSKSNIIFPYHEQNLCNYFTEFFNACCLNRRVTISRTIRKDAIDNHRLILKKLVALRERIKFTDTSRVVRKTLILMIELLKKAITTNYILCDKDGLDRSTKLSSEMLCIDDSLNDTCRTPVHDKPKNSRRSLPVFTNYKSNELVSSVHGSTRINVPSIFSNSLRARCSLDHPKKHVTTHYSKNDFYDNPIIKSSIIIRSGTRMLKIGSGRNRFNCQGVSLGALLDILKLLPNDINKIFANDIADICNSLNIVAYGEILKFDLYIVSDYLFDDYKQWALLTNKHNSCIVDSYSSALTLLKKLLKIPITDGKSSKLRTYSWLANVLNLEKLPIFRQVYDELPVNKWLVDHVPKGFYWSTSLHFPTVAGDFEIEYENYYIFPLTTRHMHRVLCNVDFRYPVLYADPYTCGRLVKNCDFSVFLDSAVASKSTLENRLICVLPKGFDAFILRMCRVTTADQLNEYEQWELEFLSETTSDILKLYNSNCSFVFYEWLEASYAAGKIIDVNRFVVIFDSDTLLAIKKFINI